MRISFLIAAPVILDTIFKYFYDDEEKNEEVEKKRIKKRVIIYKKLI